MQVNVIDRSFGNQVNITETYPNGTVTTTGQIYGNRFNLTVTSRFNDGEELRESLTGMVREDGSQYSVCRNTISHYLPYATRMSSNTDYSGNQQYQGNNGYVTMQHYGEDDYNDNQQYQSINGYATMQLTQHKRSFQR